MGHRLRMSAEISDWLADLCASQPARAAEVGAALVAVTDAPEISDLPLAVELADGPPPDPREVVDLAYQRLLEALQHERWLVAVAATERKRLQLVVIELEREPPPDPAELTQLRQRLENAQRKESQLTARSQRVQFQVEAVRAAKETAKAMYTAAEANLRIRDAFAAAASIDDDSDPAVGDLAELNRAIDAAELRLGNVARQAAQTLRDIRSPKTPGTSANVTRSGPVAGLLELRADPIVTDSRILFALEPADTVTLLAVLEDADAVAEHREAAIELAGDLLTNIRAGAWPPDDAAGPGDREVTFADSAAFLSRFLPARTDEVAARSVALAQACSFAELRESLGVTRADLARSTGKVDRLYSLEGAEMRTAAVRDAVSYVRALGGRLELTAHFDDEASVTLY